MKSIRTKFLIIMLICTLLSSAVIGGAGILNAGRVADENAERIMDSICTEKSWEIDALLSRIEQSIETISDYAMRELEDLEKFQTDQAYVDAYTDRIEDVLLNAANHTEGALAVYIRYNPEFTDPVSGLFCSREAPKSEFKKLTPTDFSQYDPSDIEHVGWYYVPVENGKATWMEPYFNQNIDTEMISYVIPLRVHDVTVGVVGMDIDFSVIRETVEGVSVYQSGYAFLVNDKGLIIYHQDFLGGTPVASIDNSLKTLAKRLASGEYERLLSYRMDGQEKQASFQNLRNGMRFVLTAPVSEIHSERKALAFQILGGTILVAAVTVLLAFLLSRRITNPLRELNTAAQKIADGDLSVSVTYQSKDEIGTLAESFRKTVSQLNHYINYIKGLAYRDPMTGLKSKTAYLEAVDRLENAIKIGCPEFGVVVFDLNGLKKVNDIYGHDFGDMLIIATSKIICDVFKHSPVYRIGGDEFTALLETADLKRYGELLEELQQSIESYNQDSQPQLKVSLARGIAIYNPGTDLSYHDVFKRADTAMYCNKSNMKKDVSECEQTLRN